MLIIEKNLLLNDPIGAIGTMKEKMYDHERFDMDEYLEVLAQSVWKWHQLGLDIKGDTLEEKCLNAINQLIDYGLVTFH